MASAAHKASLEAFVAATKGKAGIVGTKDNKKILGDCGIVPKYLDQNSADIAHAKIMGKVGGKAKGGLTFDQYCNEFAVEIGGIVAKKAKTDADGGKKIFLDALEGGAPKTTGATKAQSGGAVGRLTDTSKYTGAHKERFDESGKGKGKEGREDAVKNDGYVGNYKGEDTYDKK